MNQDDVVLCFVWFLLGMMFGGFAGGCTGTSQMKQEAVREGHAEWVADASGMAQFKWKECK